MKSKDLWDFSQKYSSLKMIKYGIILIAMFMIGLFDILPVSVFNMFLGIGALLVCPTIMIIEIEIALKKRIN